MRPRLLRRRCTEIIRQAVIILQLHLAQIHSLLRLINTLHIDHEKVELLPFPLVGAFHVHHATAILAEPAVREFRLGVVAHLAFGRGLEQRKVLRRNAEIGVAEFLAEGAVAAGSVDSPVGFYRDVDFVADVAGEYTLVFYQWGCMETFGKRTQNGIPR